MMRRHFAEVLAREGAHLAQVTDGAELASWRRRVVHELMDPQSPYALALRQTGDVPSRLAFLGCWRGLIAGMVERLLLTPDAGEVTCPSPRTSAEARDADVDAHETAVLILAALHGGGTLSQVAQDPRPLNAALDLALGRLAAPERGADDHRTG
jgi:hypothetical protein